MTDNLLSVAVVTIRTAAGREIDITDDQVEYDLRVEAGRMVLYGREVMRLKAGGVGPEQAALLLPVMVAFPGGVVGEVEPSKGPYPWDDGAEVVREKDGCEQRKWW
jgi:hypothetical protein